MCDMSEAVKKFTRNSLAKTVTPRLFVLELNAGRIHSMNTDGSDRQTIVTNCHLPDGIVVDVEAGHIYWTNMGPDNAGLGRIFRANVEIPPGQTAQTRSDIEIFFDGLPEPIDIELDHKNRVLYWTDRGDPPRGNTVNRASIDNKPGEPEIVVTHLMEGIGIALDIPNDRMFVTDFAGSVYSADLDGKNERNFLYAQGNLTGIAYAEI